MGSLAHRIQFQPNHWPGSSSSGSIFANFSDLISLHSACEQSCPLGESSVVYSPLGSENAPYLVHMGLFKHFRRMNTALVSRQVSWDAECSTHHTARRIVSNTRTVSLSQGPQYLLRQMWDCMGTEADRGCPSHGVSFLSLGRLESFPCHSKGAEVNTVFYLRDDTQG